LVYFIVSEMQMWKRKIGKASLLVNLLWLGL
jgi:hypothetical protein